MSALLSLQKLGCVDNVGSPFFSKVVVCGHCRLSFLLKGCGVWTVSALLSFQKLWCVDTVGSSLQKKCRVWTLWALCVSLLPSFLQKLWCVDTVGSPFSSKVVECGHCHVTLPLTVNEALKCNTVHSGGDDSQSLGAV